MDSVRSHSPSRWTWKIEAGVGARKEERIGDWTREGVQGGRENSESDVQSCCRIHSQAVVESDPTLASIARAHPRSRAPRKQAGLAVDAKAAAWRMGDRGSISSETRADKHKHKNEGGEEKWVVRSAGCRFEAVSARNCWTAAKAAAGALRARDGRGV
jgi:hypothetical protein